jgi:phosphate transport system protein
VRHFGQELEELNQSLLQMGGLVESSIRRSTQSLMERNKELAKDVIRDEPRIDMMQVEIDAQTTRLLALNQPVARDLRLLMATLKINTDLERMGDLAVNIAERAISLIERPPVRALVDIPQMASLVESMLLKSLDAFVKGDADLATSVLPADEEVDALRDSIYAELIALMQRDSQVVPSAINLMFVARNLERIADHATNIAEDVIFLVKGIDVRHHALDRDEVAHE